jgi:hypothetical protein
MEEDSTNAPEAKEDEQKKPEEDDPAATAENSDNGMGLLTK